VVLQTQEQEEEFFKIRTYFGASWKYTTDVQIFLKLSYCTCHYCSGWCTCSCIRFAEDLCVSSMWKSYRFCTWLYHVQLNKQLYFKTKSIYDYFIKSGHVPYRYNTVHQWAVHRGPRILAMPQFRSLVFEINNRHSLLSLNNQEHM
jgi:hypothetical protein